MTAPQLTVNLRGRMVQFPYGGAVLCGEVITRIRGSRWLVESSMLPVTV